MNSHRAAIGASIASSRNQPGALVVAVEPGGQLRWQRASASGGYAPAVWPGLALIRVGAWGGVAVTVSDIWSPVRD